MRTRACLIGLKSVLPAIAFTLGCATSSTHAASDATQSFITAANLACLVLGMKHDRTVKCLVNYQDNRPTLQITFEASDRNKIQEKINSYGPLVISMVGPDLCTSAGSGSGAALVLVDTKTRQTATYSCEQQRFNNWVAAQ